MGKDIRWALWLKRQPKEIIPAWPIKEEIVRIFFKKTHIIGISK